MTTEAVHGNAGPLHAVAYVFWHKPAGGQTRSAYEAALTAFHRALMGAPVAGLLATRALRVSKLPWLPTGGYEDWYVLRTWGGLGDLNGAAVDPTRFRAHDDVAARSASGAGAVYGLALGTADSVPSWVTWLSKPRGIPYGEFYDALLVHIGEGGSALPSGTGVWRRQLVLGPAPEFCLTTIQPPPQLPSEWSPIAAPVQTVHPEPIHATDNEP